MNENKRPYQLQSAPGNLILRKLLTWNSYKLITKGTDSNTEYPQK